MSVRVALAGGGTAGHTSPMLATADAVSARVDASIVCLGTRKGLELELVPRAGYELSLIEPVPLPRRLSVDLLALPFRLARAVRQARTVLRERRVDVLVGFGGYVSIPAYLAARLTRTPIVVHEQNALPGLANRVGARLAQAVAVTFPDTPLPGARTVGMPVSPRIANPSWSAEDARVRFDLDPDRPTLLVSGGSQGAQRLNEAVAGAKDRLLDAGVQILHVLGPKKILDGPPPQTAPNGARYRPVGFIDDMGAAYKAADLMLARAGAGTVVETAMNGVPTIYVPYPVGNGEQARNARAVVAAGGGVMVADADLTPDRLVSEVLPRILDRARLAAMSAAGRAQSPSDAAAALADIVLDVASGRKEA